MKMVPTTLKTTPSQRSWLSTVHTGETCGRYAGLRVPIRMQTDPSNPKRTARASQASESAPRLPFNRLTDLRQMPG